MGGAVFPLSCLTWGQTMVEVEKIMATFFKRSMDALLNSVPPTLHQASANPHLPWRLLDTHRQVWVSLLWGHCAFFLGPGAQFLFVPSKGLFPQSFISAGSMVVFMATSSKKAYAIPRFAAPRAPAPAAGHCWPIPLQETLKHSRYCIVIDYFPYTVHFILLTPLFFSWNFVLIFLIYLLSLILFPQATTCLFSECITVSLFSFFMFVHLFVRFHK